MIAINEEYTGGQSHGRVCEHPAVRLRMEIAEGLELPAMDVILRFQRADSDDTCGEVSTTWEASARVHPAQDLSLLGSQNTAETPPRDRTVCPVPSSFDGDQRVGEILTKYLLPEVSHTSKEHQRKIGQVDACLSAWLERPALVDDLSDPSLLNRWLSSLSRGRKPPLGQTTCHESRLRALSATSINGRRKYLRIIQVYLFGRSGSADIELRRQAEPKTMPVAWSVDQIQKIIAACLDFPELVRCDGVEVHVGRRTLLALLLIYDTGIRITALMKRKRSDVQDGVLVVPASDQKSRKEQRFRLSLHTLKMLAESPNVAGRLIPHAYYQARPDKPMRDWLTKILQSAGLPSDDKHKWHCLRRVHATQLAKSVSMEAAQRALGHSSIETTKRYVDTTQLDAVNPIDVLPTLA